MLQIMKIHRGDGSMKDTFSLLAHIAHIVNSYQHWFYNIFIVYYIIIGIGNGKMA